MYCSMGSLCEAIPQKELSLPPTAIQLSPQGNFCLFYFYLSACTPVCAVYAFVCVKPLEANRVLDPLEADLQEVVS